MSIEGQSSELIGPNTRGLPGVWPLMETYGASIEQCLEGTNISIDQAMGRDGHVGLEEEFALYRNLLRLSGDPLLGLKLGEIYQPQTYGMFGYAILSAKNLKMVFEIAGYLNDFNMGLFEWQLELGEPSKYTQVKQGDLPDDLLQIYVDRNQAGGFTLLKSVGLKTTDFTGVSIGHEGVEQLAAYEAFYGCKVNIGEQNSAFHFASELLDQDLPWANEQALEICLQACRELIEEHSPHSTISRKVVNHIIDSPGGFPSFAETAKELGFSTRSLRRKLQQEGSSYSGLVKDVRLKLAKQHLKDRLTIEQVSELLGYSETSAFSRAFKSWTGHSPQEYRR